MNKKMKAALLHGIGDIRIEDIPRPAPGSGEVLVQVEAVGICGSDVHYYAYGRIGSAVVTEPIVLGHEPAGTVVELGEEVTGPSVGTRVAVEPGWPCGECEFCRHGRYNICRSMRFLGMPPANPGAYCEYIAVPADFAFPIPDGMSAEHGSMIEPLAVGLHAVELACMWPGQTVAVLGEGSIGLFTTRCAKLAGALTIYATDLLDCRLEAACHLGADVTVNAAETDPVAAIMDATDGRGVDVVFEAAGAPETPQQAIDIAVPGGVIVMIGICQEQPVKTDITEARRKELVVRYCRRFCHSFPRAISLAAAGAVDMDCVDTHRFGLDDIAEGFEIVKNYLDGVIKATVQIPGG